MVIDVSDLFKGTVETFGAIDIVINNAGVGILEDWEKVIQINQVLLNIHGIYMVLQCEYVLNMILPNNDISIVCKLVCKIYPILC